MLSSGDEQTETELGGVEVDEVVVAFGPSAGDEVVMEPVHCSALGVGSDSGPDGHSATDVFVQVGLGAAPVGFEEAISAVPWNGYRFDAGADRVGQLGQRRSAAGDEVGDLGQVVASEPEPASPGGLFISF